MKTLTFERMTLKDFKAVVDDFNKGCSGYLKVVINKELKAPDKYFQMIKNSNVALAVQNPTPELESHFKSVLVRAERESKVKEQLVTEKGGKSSRSSRNTETLFGKPVHKDIGNYHISQLSNLAQWRADDWVRNENWSANTDGLFGFIPKFQRDSVWNLEQKQNLIISMLNEIPIGAFYVNQLPSYSKTEESEDLDIVLYDGQQRFLAIKEFMEGKFPLVVNGEEHFVGDLNIHDVIRLERTLVPIYTTSIESLDDLIDFYTVINTGGTLHTEEDISKAKSYKKR